MRQFDVAELARVAVADEGSGIQLYKRLTALAQDARIQEGFRRLAGEERHHHERFQAMLEELERGPQPAQYPDEYVDYLEALSGDGGESHAHRRAEASRGDRDALELAADFEKEQLALQQQMADLLRERHRQVVEEIIREERNHLITLAELGRKPAE